MFHVERLDEFAACLQRVLGSRTNRSTTSSEEKAILDSPLNSSTWNPQPTFSGWIPGPSPSGLQNTRNLSSRLRVRRLSPDYPLPFDRWFCGGPALAQPQIQEKQLSLGTFHVERKPFQFGSGQLGICRIRLLIFSLERYKCSTWNTRLRTWDFVRRQLIEILSHLTPLIGLHTHLFVICPPDFIRMSPTFY